MDEWEITVGDIIEAVYNDENFNIGKEAGSQKSSDDDYDDDPDKHRIDITLKQHHLSTDNNFKIEIVVDLLQSYYKHFFPAQEICTWLCYGQFGNLECREFAFTNASKYITRYMSFKNCREMKYETWKLYPMKIDIGALFQNRPPGEEPKLPSGRQPFHDLPIPLQANSRSPLQRELIFDIDLNTYNNIRTCCKETDICQKCWKFAAVACKILDASFREDFGWKHILWVFSGRRGIHCWVCDSKVRTMNNKLRKQIVNYYSLKNSYESSFNFGTRETTHVHITYQLVLYVVGVNLEKMFTQNFRPYSRSYKIAVREFRTICIIEQDILGTTKGVNKFISLLPADSCRENVTQLFSRRSTGLDRWNIFDRYWKSEERLHTTLWKSRPHLLKEIVFEYLYPKIDSAVTEEMGHLLKAPFSFHPYTFLLSTPFDPKNVDNFTIKEVPSIYAFGKESENHETRSNKSAYSIQMQRYKESMRIFKKFVISLEMSSVPLPH